MAAAPRSVLLLTDRYPPSPGGLARASQRLAGHARDTGWRVHVLAFRSDLPPGALESAVEEDIVVHRLGAIRGAVELGQAASQAVDWLQESERFSLFHGQYGSTGGFLAVYHARRHRAASYVSLRGNDLDRDLHDPERSAPLLWTLAHADAIGGVSRALVRDAAALTGRLDIRHTPNSVDAALFQSHPDRAAIRERLGWGPGPVIGFAGELRHKKGAHFILEAFRSLPPELGARLLLIGTIRPEERRALDALMAEEPEIGGRIQAIPYTHDPGDLAALYNGLDLLLSPSLWEGMPNAVLEAMACGCPVLASDAGGIPDIVTHGETGWLISRHQLHRLGEALAEVLALPEEERRRIGSAGRAWVAEWFQPGREQHELMEAYEHALASCSPL